MDIQTKPEFETFQQTLTKLIQENQRLGWEGYENLTDEWKADKLKTVQYTKGRKYLKLFTVEANGRKMLYAFLDNDGNLYKSASWNAPAKHVRGNIFNEDNGLNCCGPYGVAYLRGGSIGFGRKVQENVIG